MDNQRLFLVLLFGFSLVMLWDAWQKYSHPAPLAPTAQTSVQQPLPGSSPTGAPLPSATGAVPVAAAATESTTSADSSKAATTVVETDVYVAEISALGGDLVRLVLKQHKATNDQAHNFILFDSKHSYAAQSGLIGTGLPNHRSVWTLPGAKEELKPGSDELRVRLTAAGENGIRVAKTYVFRRDSYVIGVEHEIDNQSTASVAPHAYFQLTRDNVAPEGEGSGTSTFTGPAFYADSEKYHKVEFADVAKNKAKVPANADNGWVAMVQHYFVSAWLPAGKEEREFYLREIGKDKLAAGLILSMASIPAGGSAKIEVPLFAGPQEQNELEKIAPGFDRVVDYGWLTVIAAPIFWVLQWLNSFIGNWGWSIIAMTTLLKLAFFPLSAASYKSMAKMRLLTPKMQKLKETYADDKERMNRELMELYKKEKVNPLGGCLPILVQIPVFIALYWVLMGTVEMRGAPWILWITDLSAADTLFGHIPFVNMPLGPLPLVMGATMFISNRLNPQPPDPIQAKIMLWMPIIFTFMFLGFPSGLVLYWTVNNLLSIAQQWQVNRMIGASAVGKSSS